MRCWGVGLQSLEKFCFKVTILREITSKWTIPCLIQLSCVYQYQGTNFIHSVLCIFSAEEGEDAEVCWEHLKLQLWFCNCCAMQSFCWSCENVSVYALCLAVIFTRSDRTGWGCWGCSACRRADFRRTFRAAFQYLRGCYGKAAEGLFIRGQCSRTSTESATYLAHKTYFRSHRKVFLSQVAVSILKRWSEL